MALTTVDNGLLSSDSQYTGFKNRIINGAMVIDQRNAGAAVTANGAFPVDRFFITNGTDGTFSAQQSTSIIPTGFTHSVGITITSADTSLTAAQALAYNQRIEGYNVSDLSFGTANAQTVTLSFWVRSSLTGTFGGSLRNSAANRSYPFSYTISVANTWEQKSVTITGDTSGTWLTDSGTGILTTFALGAGVDRSGTAGAWNSNNNASATGAVSVVGTNGATWYITGVQLEKGSTATSFDYRPYGTELSLCQRYYETMGADAASGLLAPQGYGTVGIQINQTLMYKVTKRAAPTVTKVGTWALTNLSAQPSIFGAGLDNVLFYSNATGTGTAYAQNNGGNAYVTISAEL